MFSSCPTSEYLIRKSRQDIARTFPLGVWRGCEQKFADKSQRQLPVQHKSQLKQCSSHSWPPKKASFQKQLCIIDVLSSFWKVYDILKTCFSTCRNCFKNHQHGIILLILKKTYLNVLQVIFYCVAYMPRTFCPKCSGIKVKLKAIVLGYRVY